MDRKGYVIIECRHAVTDASVERHIIKVSVFLAHPYAYQRQARVEPFLYFKRDRSLNTCLALEIKVQVTVDFHQAFGRLVKRLREIIIRRTEQAVVSAVSSG